jgi:hypothetical protein
MTKAAAAKIVCCGSEADLRAADEPMSASSAAEEPYEVGYFARKHGISRDQAQRLIDKIGGNRAKLNAAAEKLSGK